MSVAQEAKTLDDQSQSRLESVVVAKKLTKDQNQSRAEPLKSEEEEPPDTAASHVAAAPGVGPMQPSTRERWEPEEEEPREGGEEVAQEGAAQDDQSDVEVEPVSPMLELDPSLDMEVMELMTSSPPPSLLHLSSPSPPPCSRRGKGRTLRPPPSSSRPSDDLAIRLRQSPFSTEASPETSPARVPVTPPPLSPPSPLFGSSPFSRESPPLSKVNPTAVRHPPGDTLWFSPHDY